MIDNIITEILKLTRSIDLIDDDQAKEIVQASVKEIMNKTGAHICDVFAANASFEGFSRPKPFLESLVTVDNANRNRSGPYYIEQKEPGLWSWVYEKKRPIWLQDIIDRDRNKPKKHVLTDDLVDPIFLKNTFHKTDSIIVIPLLEKDHIWGVISIELPKRKMFDEDTYKNLLTFSKYITRIIWKYSTYAQNKNGTQKAIKDFSERISRKLEILPYDVKTAFFIRPFKDSFEIIDKKIRDYLEKHEIKVLGFTEGGFSKDGLENIKTKILRSHFILIDVTGCNPNVLIELGIALGSGKKFVLFHKKVENFELPFDITRTETYLYEERDEDIQFFDSGSSNAKITLNDILDPVLDDIEDDPEFLRASPFKSYQE